MVCPTEEFFTNEIFILITTQSLGFYFGAVFIVQWFWTLFSIIFFISCITYHIYFTTRHCTSDQTKKLQKMFFIGNLIQIAIPSIFWAIPGFLLVFSYFHAYYNQSLNNIGIAFVSLHGVASTLATVFIHVPYREFVKSIGKRAKVTSRSESAHVNQWRLFENGIQKTLNF